MCETYGLAKEGARHHGYTGQRGYHPLLAIAAGTGDVLMSRLREGRANTVRGAAHFLRETVGRVRHGGATGQLTVRADSGFYAHALVVVCRKMDVRFSITIRQHARLRELIEAIPEEDWTPVPYWIDGGADVAETTYRAFQGESEAAPVRLIVRRVKPTPGLTAPSAPDPSTRLPNRPIESHRPGPRLSSPACCPADPTPAPLPRTAIGAPNDNQRPPPAPFIGIERGPSHPTALTPCPNPKAAPRIGGPEAKRRQRIDVRHHHSAPPADALNTPPARPRPSVMGLACWSTPAWPSASAGGPRRDVRAPAGRTPQASPGASASGSSAPTRTANRG